MKTSTIFWGSLLIFVGILFLLNNFDVMDVTLNNIIDFWPVVLIIWGISLLKIPDIVKKIMAGASALLLAWIVVGFFSFHWTGDVFDDMDFEFGESFEEPAEPLPPGAESEERTLNIEYDTNYTYGEFNFNGGAGEFDIKGTTADLVLVKALGLQEDLKFRKFKDKKEVVVDLDFGKTKKIKGMPLDREALIKLNPETIWDVDIHVGAAEMDCDFRDYRTRSVNVKAGAADINLILGNKYDSLEVRVDAGASNIEIRVPKTSGCEIIAKIGLSAKDFYGFEKHEDGIYRSENYQTSDKIIKLYISGGVSNFEVDRY